MWGKDKTCVRMFSWGHSVGYVIGKMCFRFVDSLLFQDWCTFNDHMLRVNTKHIYDKLSVNWNVPQGSQNHGKQARQDYREECSTAQLMSAPLEWYTSSARPGESGHRRPPHGSVCSLAMYPAIESFRHLGLADNWGQQSFLSGSQVESYPAASLCSPDHRWKNSQRFWPMSWTRDWKRSLCYREQKCSKIINATGKERFPHHSSLESRTLISGTKCPPRFPPLEKPALCWTDFSSKVMVSVNAGLKSRWLRG